MNKSLVEKFEEYYGTLTQSKNEWPAGPWTKEPDRYHRNIGDYEFLLNRSHLGALCGYVGVPSWHPWYQKHYDSVDASVHGGLTYSGSCHGVICHTGPQEVWWLGFDCAHYMDQIPAMKSIMPDVANFGGSSYKDITYVRDQNLDLLRQAMEAVTWKHKILKYLHILGRLFS